MRGKRGTLIVIALAGLLGCAMERHREQVRQGFLTRGLHRDAFVKEWGPPNRTFTLPGDKPVFRYNAWTGGAWTYPVYEIWEYQAKAICLAFDGVRLVSWETGRTDCTPRSPSNPAKREPAGQGPQPYPPYPE